jgi:hypothetical protein
LEHTGILIERKEDAKILFETISSLIGNQKLLSFYRNWMEEAI